MSVIGDVVLAVIGLAQATEPYAAITKGPMPLDNGISMEMSAGSADTVFLNKGMAYSLDMVCNGKHTNQATVLEALSKIHDTLVKAQEYPGTAAYQITNITTNGAPVRIGQEANKQWLFGSGLTIKFYYR